MRLIFGRSPSFARARSALRIPAPLTPRIMGFTRHLVLSLSVVLASSCTPRHAPRPAPSMSCTATGERHLTLTGSIREEDSGRPAEAVLVAVTGTPSRTLTDSMGAYRIEGIRPGRYEVTARRVGYEPARDTALAIAPELHPNCEAEVILDFRMKHSPLCVDC